MRWPMSLFNRHATIDFSTEVAPSGLTVTGYKLRLGLISCTAMSLTRYTGSDIVAVST